MMFKDVLRLGILLFLLTFLLYSNLNLGGLNDSRVDLDENVSASGPVVSSIPLAKTTRPPVTTVGPRPVSLQLFVPNQSYEFCCGLFPDSVRVWGYPVVRNRGGVTAHNVVVSFELFLQDGSRILLGGEDGLQRVVGDLGGGESASSFVEFNISLVDGYLIQDQGAFAVFEISSDEQTIRLVENFSVPVE